MTAFPYEACSNLIYFADQSKQAERRVRVSHQRRSGSVLPNHLLAIQPAVEGMLGKKGPGGWEVFSVTSWIYRPVPG
jgi:allophanate hydrolase subunit 1